MTFREYMIQKLEGLDPPPKKKETKFSTIFYIPRKYTCGFWEIKIPKPGTRYYKKEMRHAWSVMQFTVQDGENPLLFLWPTSFSSMKSRKPKSAR